MVLGLECGQNVGVVEDWHLLQWLNNCLKELFKETNKSIAGTAEIESHTGIMEKNAIQN